MNLNLIKYQTAKWYEQDTKEKVVTVLACDFKGMIQALGEAKKIMKERVDFHDSEYEIPYDEEKWLKKYFGEE